jgi:hypothetical protein
MKQQRRIRMDNVKINEKMWSILTEMICLINEEIGKNKREQARAEAEFLKDLEALGAQEIQEDEEKQ